MKFLSIELKGFKRFGLNNIKLFSLNMVEFFQIILGRNGCGKSELLKVMNPGPADPKAFDKDGHKIFVCKKDNDTYTLTSTFSPSAKHSFIRNGSEELNEGGTAMVQKDLCKRVLGVDLDYLEVATGLEPFTSMTPSRKRELFTKMCVTNYDYAIKVYNRICTAKRDVEGALKTTKKRLTSEVTNNLLDEELDKTRKYLSELTLKSQELYQKKIPNTPTLHEAQSKVSDISKAIDDLSKIFWNTRKEVIKNQNWSPAEIVYENECLKEELVKENTKLTMYSNEHAKISDKLNSGVFMDEDELKFLNAKVLLLSDENKLLKNTLKTSVVPFSVSEAKMALDMVKDRVQDILMEMADNSDGWYTHELYLVKTEELSLLKSNLSRSQRLLDNIAASLKHYDHMSKKDTTECPECKHSFRAGYDEKVHNQIKERYTAGEKHIAEITAKINDLETTLVSFNKYHAEINALSTIIYDTPQLKELWDEIIDLTNIRSHPSGISAKIDQFYSDLQSLSKIEENNKELKKISDRINAVDAESQKDMQNLLKSMEAVETNIGACTATIANINRTIERNLNYIKQVNSVQAYGDNMLELKKKLEEGIKQQGSAILNNIIDMALRETHVEIAAVSNKVSEMSNRKALIEDLKSQIKKLEKEEQAFKLLMDAFSPTDGLIAEGLLGFIKQFVKAMNSIISKNWSYGLTIKDCSTDPDSADLNYKFPVYVEGDPTPREDVKHGSTGMREIINLAYRLVAMSYMGLAEYPLFVDEFGSSFDAEHKARAPYAIKAISEQMSFSQIFIISHHQMDYGVFPNAQYCVIDRNNISLDDVRFNEHLVIE